MWRNCSRSVRYNKYFERFQFIEERLNMLNSGLGFSDEFEMEACSYSAKSSSKFMQQYREWTYTMRKESSAFFRSVKDKACYTLIKSDFIGTIYF